MMAKAPEKFMFDNDFGSPDSGRSGTPKPKDKSASASDPNAEQWPGAEGQDGDGLAYDDPSGEAGGGEAMANPPGGVHDQQAQAPEAPPEPTYSEQELQSAREEALKQGRQEGRDEATRDMAGAVEQRTVDTLDAINALLAKMFDAYTKDTDQHSRDAVAVASVMVRKLFPALNMDKSLQEIEHMIGEAMKRTSGSPKLIVRVAKDMHPDVEAKAQELAALRGREGTLTVIGDDEVAMGDARVEWDGGGMVRDSAFIWREIDDIIERNLGQRVEMPPQTEKPSEQAPPATPDTKAEAEVVHPAPVGENEPENAQSPDSPPAPDIEATTGNEGTAASEHKQPDATASEPEPGQVHPAGDDTPEEER